MKLFSPWRFLGALGAALLIGAGTVQSPLVAAYTDVEGTPFAAAVTYLTQEGIIAGYEDGTVKPYNTINRAEFLKVVALAGGLEKGGDNCFSDVTDQWFAPYICAATEAGIVGGYADGSFKPENTISLVEALKIASKGLEVKTEEPEGTEWYSEYLETFAAKNYIPSSLDYYDEELTRGEAFELLWRVLTDNETQEATTLDEFKGPTCEDFEVEQLDGIDLERVKDTWISWTNNARATHGLPAYTEDEQLDRTATIWSSYGRDLSYMTHARPGSSGYYDYYAIQDWFEDLGLSFQSVGGYTFTENIGRGPYSCKAEDCTDELLSAIEYTFDYFMSEAGSSYAPHYNSIMNSNFQKIGFGIVVTDTSYYMTVHYATILESTLAPFCD